MTPAQYFKHLRQLIEDNETSRVFEDLKLISSENNKFNYNPIIMTSARYKNIVKAEMLGLADKQSKLEEINNITFTLLQIIDQFEERIDIIPETLLKRISSLRQFAIDNTSRDDFFIKYSPLEGTFYLNETPYLPSFVNEGELVEPGKKLCLIEAFRKAYNAIEAEVYGIIEKIYPENGDFVKYDSPLFLIKKIDAPFPNKIKPRFHALERTMIATFVNVISRNQSNKDFVLTAPVEGRVILDPISEKMVASDNILREDQIFFHIDIGENKKIPIGSPISGKILEIFKKDNEIVNKGTSLLLLEAIEK